MNLMQRMITLSLLMCLAGCTSVPLVKERFIWPPAPDEPRIEWIGRYKDQLDLRSGEKSFISALTGEEDSISLANPATVAADGEGRVYISDLAKSGVMVFDFNKKAVHMLGGTNSIGLFKNPSGIAFDADGNIYAADLDARKIYLFNKNETPLRSIDLSASVKSIGFFAIDKARKRIIVPDVRGHKLLIVDYDGKLIKTIDQFRDKKDGFSFPTSVAIDPKGNILVADSMNSRVVRLTPEGDFLSTFGQRGDNIGDMSIIKGVAVDSEGHIYVTDAKANRMQIFNDNGETLLVIGQYSNNPNQVGGFNAPAGIYIDQNDAIYVVEKLGRSFQIFQYLNSRYLAQHPITKDTPLAKKTKDVDKKEAK